MPRWGVLVEGSGFGFARFGRLDAAVQILCLRAKQIMDGVKRTAAAVIQPSTEKTSVAGDRDDLRIPLEGAIATQFTEFLRIAGSLGGYVEAWIRAAETPSPPGTPVSGHDLSVSGLHVLLRLLLQQDRFMEWICELLSIPSSKGAEFEAICEDFLERWFLGLKFGVILSQPQRIHALKRWPMHLHGGRRSATSVIQMILEISEPPTKLVSIDLLSVSILSQASSFCFSLSISVIFIFIPCPSVCLSVCPLVGSDSLIQGNLCPHAQRLPCSNHGSARSAWKASSSSQGPICPKCLLTNLRHINPLIP